MGNPNTGEIYELPEGAFPEKGHAELTSFQAEHLRQLELEQRKSELRALVEKQEREATSFDGLIFDCEIEKGIGDGEQVPGVLYCNGWRDFENMGLTVVCVYDYKSDGYRVFCKDNLTDFSDLIASRSWAIGFNNQQFDEQLLRVHGVDVPEVKSYDLMQEIWAAAGYGREFNKDTHTGYGLDAICSVNFGMNKSGHGANAPVLWQQGKIGQVIDYCLRDVLLTKRLLDKVLADGTVIDPKTPRTLKIRKPGMAGNLTGWYRTTPSGDVVDW